MQTVGVQQIVVRVCDREFKMGQIIVLKVWEWLAEAERK